MGKNFANMRVIGDTKIADGSTRDGAAIEEIKHPHSDVHNNSKPNGLSTSNQSVPMEETVHPHLLTQQVK